MISCCPFMAQYFFAAGRDESVRSDNLDAGLEQILFDLRRGQYGAVNGGTQLFQPGPFVRQEPETLGLRPQMGRARWESFLDFG